MAFSNEEEKELAVIKKNNRGDYIIVKKIKNKNSGNESLDVRQYYTDKEDNIAFTKKGLRISAENALDVIKAMIDILETDEKQDLRDELDSILEEDEDSDEDEDDIIIDDEEDDIDEEDDDIK